MLNLTELRKKTVIEGSCRESETFEGEIYEAVDEMIEDEIDGYTIQRTDLNGHCREEFKLLVSNMLFKYLSQIHLDIDDENAEEQLETLVELTCYIVKNMLTVDNWDTIHLETIDEEDDEDDEDDDDWG